jgi:hypothetical protein
MPRAARLILGHVVLAQHAAKLANATIAVKQHCCRIVRNFEAFYVVAA